MKKGYGFDKETFKKDVVYNVKSIFRKTIDEATPAQVFQAVAYAVKDIIIDEWIATHKEYEKQDAKTVYYLSMEFLMGRALGNNMINICAYDEIREALDDVEELKAQGTLFTEDTYKDQVIDFKKRSTVVKALCLHIAHDCNLACRYCFAEEGEYHGRRALMSYEVGKQALDFLIANSGN